ncbi:MAG: YfhO family protein [bacterium]|nr:YfhO family protein [bacterium]
MNKCLHKLLEPFLVAVLSLIIISIAFYPAVFEHKLIFQYNYVSLDGIDLNIPRRYLAVQSLRNYGEIPLWEPLIGSGVPLFAESEAGVFHPTLLLFFLNDLTLATNLTILSAILIAMLGSYAWGRSLKLGPLASGIGAVAFSFCKIMLLRTAGLNMLHVLAWLPGSLAVIHLLAVTGKKRYWFSLIIIWLLQLLASHMQMFFICQLACGLYFVILMFFSPSNTKIKLPRWQLFIAYLLAIIFTVALSSVQLLPTQELVSKSIRNNGTPSQTLEQHINVSPNLKMLLIFVNPFYECQPLLPHTPEGFQYIGFFPVLLCVCINKQKRLRVIICLWSLVLFFMFTAMGPRYGIFYCLYKYFPYVSSFRMAGRFALPMVCFMTILSAVGAQNLGELLERWGGKRMSLSVLGSILIITCLDVGYVNYKIQGYLPASWNDKPAILNHINRPQRIYSPYSVLAFSTYEYYFKLHNSAYTLDYKDAYWQHKSLLSFGVSNIFGVATPDDYLSRCEGIVSYYSFALQEGLDKGMAKLLSLDEHSVKQIAPNIDNWFRVQAVSHIITPMPLPKGWPQSEFSQVQSVPIPEIPLSQVYIYTLVNPVNKIRLVPVLQSAPPRNCLDLEQYLQIHTGSLYEPDFARPADIGKVIVEKSTNNTLSLTTQCDQDAYLVISQSYDSNWQASVDGQPAFISLTNLNMQSLPVPKGKHRVELRYVSPAFEKGWKISLAALILFIILGIWALRHPSQPAALNLPEADRQP